MTASIKDPQIRAVLKQPFAQQVAFFRGKLGNLVPTEKWDDIWKSAHDRAFMVAGAQNADLLADLAAAVDRSISEGIGIGEFRKQFAQIVKKHGWDHSGERNWRTRVIYRTNAATSYAAGRLAQLREGGFPFWMYKHGGSSDPRPQHLAWDGLVLPADHPFWSTHSPPNGWGCSCRVVGLRRKEDARRLGGDPDRTLPDGWDSIDAATGEPEGVDRGWGYQPGATSTLFQQLQDKVDTLPAPLASALATSLQTSARLPALSTVDDFVAYGRERMGSMPDPAADPQAFVREMMATLRSEVGTLTPARVQSGGQGAKQVIAASRLFPDAWTKVADRKGPLFVKGASGRGWHYTSQTGGSFRLSSFGAIQDAEAGSGWILTSPTDIGVAVHEFAHRLQASLPELDDLFQQLHRRRTDGTKLKRLRDLTGSRSYKTSEVTREDHYYSPYQGKEYGSGRGALEMMTMAFEALLSVHESSLPHRVESFRKMYTVDREMFELAIGLLFGWKP